VLDQLPLVSNFLTNFWTEHFDGACLSPNSVRNAVWHALNEPVLPVFTNEKKKRCSTVYIDNSLGLLARNSPCTTIYTANQQQLRTRQFKFLCFQLFKPKEDKDDSTKTNVEPPKALLTACKQIVDCLIENVLRLEETSLVQEAQSHGSSQRLVACLTTLYLFAKIRPQLLVDHAITLQPYLSLKCQVNMLTQLVEIQGVYFI